MKKLLIIPALFAGITWGQIIDNSNCEAFTDDPFFNNSFIKNNNIKSITGDINTKKKLHPMQTRGLVTHYRFNEDGQLIMQYNTHLKSSSDIDTTVIRYHYDDDNNLVTKRLNDNSGFYSYNYEYDSSGLLVSEKYCRDKNAGPSKEEFKLGKQYVIVSEKFENEWVNDKELKRTYYNNYGRPYQEKIFRWDDKGYLIEEETVLLLNRKRNKTTYEYNEKGLVTKKIQSSNVTGNGELVYKYTYDEVGNLLESNEYRNGKHISKREVIYTDTMLMKAIIVVDIATEYMSVVKYDYSFFGEDDDTAGMK